MTDKLVTLAIRTYHRAQKIKAVLTNNGIPTEIHNLNQENPELAVGVRVRIKESDLPRALKIVESVEKEWESDTTEKPQKTVLIPVDLADMIDKTIDYGFQLASDIGASVDILYAYHIPAYTITSNNDLNTYSITDNEMLRRIVNRANADIDNLKNLIQRKIDSNEIPAISFEFILKQGVPDEIIPDYVKKSKPDLIVMGTRGRRPNNELIGSVAAEVIETSSTPVMAIPAMSTSTELKRIAFLTNFDQKDLIAIDKAIELFGKHNPELFFVHASDKNNVWNEVMLEGIKSYFKNHYPGINTNYSIIASNDSPETIEDFLQANKIDLLAFNTRKRLFLSRLFNPGLAYKLVLNTNTMLFATHI